MSEDRSSRLFLFRIIPLLMLVSFVAWCSSGNRTRGESLPMRTELLELLQEVTKAPRYERLEYSIR